MHYRAISIVHQDKKSSSNYSLRKDKAVSVHIKNLQYLPTENYNVKNNLSPLIMTEGFTF